MHSGGVDGLLGPVATVYSDVGGAGPGCGEVWSVSGPGPGRRPRSGVNATVLNIFLVDEGAQYPGQNGVRG